MVQARELPYRFLSLHDQCNIQFPSVPTVVAESLPRITVDFYREFSHGYLWLYASAILIWKEFGDQTTGKGKGKKEVMCNQIGFIYSHNFDIFSD